MQYRYNIVNNMFNNISIGGNNGGGQINNKQSGDSKIKPKQSDGSMVKGPNPATNLIGSSIVVWE